MSAAPYSGFLDRIRRGDKLHMQLVGSQRVWWLESPHENIDDAVVTRAIAEGEIGDAGDSLFGLHLNSQTYTNEVSS